jgi:lysophospholipase L1-like esterase
MHLVRWIFALVIAVSFMSCSDKEEVKKLTVTVPVDKDSTQTPLYDTTINYLALGDSYTIGESVDSVNRWPSQLASMLTDSLGTEVALQFIARTGWTTDELNAGIDAASLNDSYNLVSLLIGVNNEYRGRSVSDFIPEFEVLLERAIGFANNDSNRVFVVSIPDYGYTPFGQSNQPQISARLAVYNQAIDSVCASYGISYIFITDISEDGLNQPNLVAGDGLHPSGTQYGFWVERIYPVVKEKIRL